MTLAFIVTGTIGFIGIAVRFAARNTHKQTSPASIK